MLVSPLYFIILCICHNNLLACNNKLSFLIEHVEVGAEPIIREKKAERRDKRHVPVRQESMMEMESMIDISPEETWDGEDELEIFMRVGEKVLNERGILVDGVLGGARQEERGDAVVDLEGRRGDAVSDRGGGRRLDLHLLFYYIFSE